MDKKKTKVLKDRSHCLSCKHQLAWQDNIPIFSWIFLLGKCRKCRKSIGYPEILAELGVGSVFTLSFLMWPSIFDFGDALFLLSFIVFLIFISLLAFLFIYDARYKCFPTKILLATFVVAVVFFVLSRLGAHIDREFVLNFIGALLVLPGLYFFLYKVSKEQWVGSGDWLLALPIAIVLGHFWLAFATLLFANLIATIVMLPTKRKLKQKVPFGPFLIIGFLLTWLGLPVIMPFIDRLLLF